MTKSFFGIKGNLAYAIKLEALKGRDITKLIECREMEILDIGMAFKHGSLKSYVDAKHKNTLNATKKWVREFKPSEFFACWQADTTFYKDDCVKIYYKE